MFFLVSSEDADTKGREPPSGSHRNGVEATSQRTAGPGDRLGIRECWSRKDRESIRTRPGPHGAEL